MTKGLNEQVEEFRNRSLAGTVYQVLWVDALHEKVQVDGRIVSMAVFIVCGVDENGHRDINAVESMAEESKSPYGGLFQNFVRPFPEHHGSAARCISCGIFLSMCRRKRRNPSLRHPRNSGWRLRLSSPESAHMM